MLRSRLAVLIMRRMLIRKKIAIGPAYKISKESAASLLTEFKRKLPAVGSLHKVATSSNKQTNNQGDVFWLMLIMESKIYTQNYRCTLTTGIKNWHYDET